MCGSLRGVIVWVEEVEARRELTRGAVGVQEEYLRKIYEGGGV